MTPTDGKFNYMIIEKIEGPLSGINGRGAQLPIDF